MRQLIKVPVSPLTWLAAALAVDDHTNVDHGDRRELGQDRDKQYRRADEGEDDGAGATTTTPNVASRVRAL